MLGTLRRDIELERTSWADMTRLAFTVETYCIGHAFGLKLQLAATVAHEMLATHCTVAVISPTITR